MDRHRFVYRATGCFSAFCIEGRKEMRPVREVSTWYESRLQVEWQCLASTRGSLGRSRNDLHPYASQSHPRVAMYLESIIRCFPMSANGRKAQNNKSAKERWLSYRLRSSRNVQTTTARVRTVVRSTASMFCARAFAHGSGLISRRWML